MSPTNASARVPNVFIDVHQEAATKTPVACSVAFWSPGLKAAWDKSARANVVRWEATRGGDG